MSCDIEKIDFAKDVGRFIQAYMNDESILNKKELEIYNRLIDINDELKGMNHKTTKDLLEFHKEKYKISLSQARKDLEKAMNLFNKIEIIDPSTILRLTLYQTDYFLNLCKADGDSRNAANFLDLKLKIVDLLIKNTNFNPADILPNTYIIYTGKEAKKQLNLDDYDNTEVIQFIEKLEIEKAEKKRLIQEVNECANK